jgi:hypothetical protein
MAAHSSRRGLEQEEEDVGRVLATGGVPQQEGVVLPRLVGCRYRCIQYT